MKNYNATRLIISALVLAGLFILAACGPADPVVTPQAEAPVEGLATAEVVTNTTDSAELESYPAPPATDLQSGEAYPGSDPLILPPTFTPSASYPPMATVEAFQEPRFRIDQPVSAAATTLTGQAPPDTPLAVMDITYNGALLGTGRSDSNGQFSIQVAGLVDGNRIGLGIAELTEGQTLDQMAQFYFPYRGEGFMNLPNLGIFFDTALVTP